MRAVKLAFLISFLASPAWAAPSISAATGTFSGYASNTSANTITITGSGFGTKTRAKPTCWNDFETGFNPISTLGGDSTWDVTEGTMRVSSGAFSGTWNAGNMLNWDPGHPADPNTVLTIACHDEVGYGEQVHTYFVHYESYTLPVANINLKTHRIYEDINSGTATNMHNGYDPGNGWRNEFEGADPQTDWDFGSQTPRYNVFRGTWVVEEWLIQWNSANQAADGKYYVYQKDYRHNKSSLKTDGATNTGTPDEAYIMTVLAGDPAIGEKMMFWDDIYVDHGPDAWARAFIADANTMASMTKWTPVIPASWSDTKIVGYFHQGQFASGDTVYLFVCDSANSCNATGTSLTIGGSQQGGGGDTIAPGSERWRFKSGKIQNLRF